MQIPAWAQTMLVLVGILVGIGIVAFVVTELLMKRGEAIRERRLARKRRGRQ